MDRKLTSTTGRSIGFTLALVLAVSVAGMRTGYALEVQMNFDNYTEPTVVTSEYRDDYGVTFPRGVVVAPCAPAHCGAARSSPNVAHAGQDNESQGHPFELEIPEGGASGMTMYARSDLNAHSNPPREILFGAEAFDVSGTLIATDAVFAQTTDDWQQVQLVDPMNASRIKRARVRIFGVRPDLNRNVEENFIAIDDLALDGDIILPDRDRVPPVVEILDPSIRTFAVKPTLDLRVRASDNRDLARVERRLIATDGTQSPPTTMCGSPSTGACGPLYERTTTVDLTSFAPAHYAVLVTAFDQAGLSAEDSIEIDLVDVSLPFIEVNQGVQNGPSFVSSNQDYEYFAQGPRIPGRDTLVRLYPFADGYTAPGFGPSLGVTITERSGSTRSIVIPPNTQSATSVQPASTATDFTSRQDEAMLMRSSPARTMDYVIPAGETRDATELHVTMLYRGRPVGQRIHVTLNEPAAMGLNLIGVNRGGPAPTQAAADATIVPYLKATFPVDEVRVLSYRSFTPSPNIFEGALDDCGDLLWEVWWEFGGDDAPASTDFGKDYVIPTVGLLNPGAAPGGAAAGCAYVGDAAPGGDERIGATAITELTGDVAAQEIGHNLGLGHVSSSHNEVPSGPWPFNHGSLDPVDFGMAATATRPPSGPGDYGQWQVRLISDCPAGLTRSGARFSCPDHSTEVHDFMSYGASVNQAPEFTTRGNWASSRTMFNLWGSLTQNTRLTPLGPGASNAPASTIDPNAAGRVEAFLIEAQIEPNGDVRARPVGRKRVPTQMLTNDEPEGPLTIELRSASGEILGKLRTTPSHVHESGVAHRHSVRAAIPFVPGVAELRLSGQGIRTFKLRASPNAPQVQLVSPRPGESFPNGTHTLRFNGSDADGDPLMYMIQYSPDGGEKWQGIEDIGPGEPNIVTFDVSQLIPGNQALFRVMATDGLNTTVAVTDCLAVGTDAIPKCDRALDILPAMCPNAVDPRSSVLNAALAGESGFDVGSVVPSSVRLEGVPVLRTSTQDVATPYHPVSGKQYPSECTPSGADGTVDLALEFDTSALMAQIGPVSPGEVRVLHLTGRLDDAHGGETFNAEDVVVFVGPGDDCDDDDDDDDCDGDDDEDLSRKTRDVLAPKSGVPIQRRSTRWQ